MPVCGYKYTTTFHFDLHTYHWSYSPAFPTELITTKTCPWPLLANKLPRVHNGLLQTGTQENRQHLLQEKRFHNHASKKETPKLIVRLNITPLHSGNTQVQCPIICHQRCCITESRESLTTESLLIFANPLWPSLLLSHSLRVSTWTPSFISKSLVQNKYLPPDNYTQVSLCIIFKRLSAFREANLIFHKISSGI